MGQRRYSTRIEHDDAVVVASVDFWNAVMDHLEDQAKTSKKYTDELYDLVDHIEYWVERTKFKDRKKIESQ